MKITAYEIKCKNVGIDKVKELMKKKLEKLELFCRLHLYTYSFHVNSTSGTHLLIRIKFNDYYDKYDEFSFDKLLRKLRFTFDKSEEELTDEMLACCVGSRMADYMKIYGVEDYTETVIHQMMNSLGLTYIDEIMLYQSKATQIFNLLYKNRRYRKSDRQNY